MSLSFAPSESSAIPLYLVRSDGLDGLLDALPPDAGRWATINGFSGKSGQVVVIPAGDGGIQSALVGLGNDESLARTRFTLGGARAKLPDGVYALSSDLSQEEEDNERLGWLLAGYRFTRYLSGSSSQAQLVGPKDPARAARLETLASGEQLTRDLINTPAEDMGPNDLADAAKDLAAKFDATVSVIEGDDLLEQNFPLIHTVGRAAERAPRLIEMNWGSVGPQLTLVGKGVCFDTGGLNLKPGASMGLMKKDMGGAAAVLGLAHMIMSQRMGVRLRVIIPAVENAVAGNAFRPGDVFKSRKGLTVEINNTDAEGRLVLADALALADEARPDLIISMATLTGAARVAVGPDLAPFYTDRTEHAAALENAGARVADPVWRMPFHAPYESMIEPAIADLDNAPAGGFAGSITAALFLRRFVTETSYMHFDIYGWQPSNAPARPKGGVGQGTRALFAALPDMLGL